MDTFLKRNGKSATKASEPAHKATDDLPWVEKYRPKTVDQVACQDEIVSLLKKCVDSEELPNLLFYGPPGTGKTSTILAFCRDIFTPEAYADRVLELNASDERGIAVIREKVKQFAQFAASDRTASGKPCPPFKVVIMDEADSLTKMAQAALRRMMERESKTTRFCLICNYITSIIEPISSRCAKFRFKPLTGEAQKERLRAICTAENVRIQPAALDLLVDQCEGDLRRAINALQSASCFAVGEGQITANIVNEVCRRVPSEIIDNFLRACAKGNYEEIETAVLRVEKEAYSVRQLMEQLHDKLISDAGVDDLSKARVLWKVAMCEKAVLEGADEVLQLMSLGTTASKYLQN